MTLLRVVARCCLVTGSPLCPQDARRTGSIGSHSSLSQKGSNKNYMQRKMLLITSELLIALSLAFAAWQVQAAAQSSSQSADYPIVRAVLFWMNGCPNCHQVLNNVLPVLQEKYGAQLEIQLLEVVTSEDFDTLIEVAKKYEIPNDLVAVPFLVVGDRVLIGSISIPEQFPGIIEDYLAAGGVNYPDWLSEASMSPQLYTGRVKIGAGDSGAAPAAPPKSSGFSLAIAIMIGMLASLVYSGVVFVRGAGDIAPARKFPWKKYLTPVLAIVGLGVAIYLAYVETQAVDAVCGPVGDCNAVQSSPYSKIYGILPVGVLGALGYLAILAAWFYPRLRTDRLAQAAPFAIFIMALFGVLFSLYLTYLEPFVIRAVCIWCLSSSAIMSLLLLLSVKPALQALRTRLLYDGK